MADQRLHLYRGISPCRDCTERFTACHDKCPKDLRGEFGYRAWKTENEAINAERKKYDEKHSGKFKC